MAALPEPVRRVAEHLASSRAEARLEEFPEGTPTAREAAKAVGCELGQIVKTLVFECDGRFVLALVPGDRRAAADKIGAAAGCAQVRVAAPEQVQAATGFAPGAVAPFALPPSHRVLIERTLLAREIVWIGAGSTHHMAGLAPRELVRVARATPVDVVETAT